MNCTACANRRIVNAKLLRDGRITGLVKLHRSAQQEFEWQVMADHARWQHRRWKLANFISHRITDAWNFVW
jgi:hypothetical protein